MLTFLREYVQDLRAHRVLAIGAALATGVSVVLAVFDSPNRAWWIAAGLGVVVVLQTAAAWRSWRQSEARAASLPQRLDDLMREGMEVVDEMSEPLESRYPDHHYPLFGEAEWYERASDFYARARALLVSERPHLLPGFAAALNAARRRERERLTTAEPDDGASNAVKLRHFAEVTDARPRILIEAVLEGLADARGKLDGRR